ncbi:MAG TPA: SDR family NAD(P)-dependent oxidoreductase [Acetobacteraceae bacterium]|nr:SDR family NAD(P)-dependent oxidoreductase [Acetobacteraceae bacterium]
MSTAALLQGMRVLVTGAASGIGLATARALAAAGARVALLDRDGEGAARVAGALPGGPHLALAASVADAAQVGAAFRALDAAWGGLDALVNNAGIAANCPTLELSDEAWRGAVGVNLDGVFFCAREAGRSMVASRRGGAIVNLGSIYSVVAAPNRLAYVATKAAVAMMTKALALEWAPHRIRVNGVAPGYVDTPLVRALAAEGRIDVAALERRTPLGRLATPDEVADAILYLLEPRAAYITGQILGVDGGWTANGYL